MTCRNKDIREEISGYFKSKELTLSELADSTNVSVSHLSRVLETKERPLSQQLLDRINNILGTDFKLENTKS